jgi:hypothetical protein
MRYIYDRKLIGLKVNNRGSKFAKDNSIRMVWHESEGPIYKHRKAFTHTHAHTLLLQTTSTTFSRNRRYRSTAPDTPVSSHARPLTLGKRHHVALTAAAIAEWLPPVHSDFSICPRNSDCGYTTSCPSKRVISLSRRPTTMANRARSASCQSSPDKTSSPLVA